MSSIDPEFDREWNERRKEEKKYREKLDKWTSRGVVIVTGACLLGCWLTPLLFGIAAIIWAAR